MTVTLTQRFVPSITVMKEMISRFKLIDFVSLQMVKGQGVFQAEKCHTL